MAETIIKYNDSKRLVYLDPSNIETINGVSVTPDYTDYCVMFRLMADVVNRMDIIGVDGTGGEYEHFGITWSSSSNNGDSKKVYFTSGSKIDSTERNYYTTYYTDINYRDLSEDDVVEGLGVESIDIALENFYAATVKIKFVDVRGSALFGREEAIHKNTRLTAENVYGCFFTMPYPKFTLQAKGYYGKAMTYQLTCVGFNGSFDSGSGNFITDVTFIGYDFSCLSDLPLRYVILAPCDNEIGRKYWDKHAADDATWKLKGPDGPEDPQLLIDVYSNIKSALSSDSELNVNDFIEVVGIVDAKDKINVLSAIKKEYEASLTGAIKNTRDKKYYCETTTIVIDKDIEVGFSSYDGKITIKISCLSDKIDMETTKPSNPNIVKLLGLINEYNKTYIDDVLEYNGGSMEFKSNGVEHLRGSNVYDYVFTLDDNGLYKSIIGKINSVENSVGGPVILNKASGSSRQIKSMLKFTPYIGNVIKTILCHVETFIHVVYATSSEIYKQMSEGKRSGGAIGLNVTNSDVSRLNIIGAQRFAANNSQIPPFPGIFVNDTEENEENEKTYFFERSGWPGDIGEKAENWLEYKLVKNFAEASKRRTSNPNEAGIDEDGDDMRDLMCASYIFFKNLWDRWLVTNKKSEFTVKNLYQKFVFIDSFYRSVEWKLHVNADILMDCIENKNTKNTVYTILKDLASAHNCMLFSYGDTLSFTNVYSKNNGIAEKNVEKMFTPVPLKDVEEVSSMNKIVFMYHNKPAQNTGTGNTEYTDDNMYFSDGENLTEFTNKAFASVGRSYVVPSFCVMFGKLSNSIFTKVSVNMEVPTVTNQTIESIGQISKMYSASKRKVSFYGQDLFPVFSNYSYICEFEMLGDTQITPLMYFQLFNIPVFKGVYMIFSVVHSMTQGKMITRVKGMRMSKEAIPFSEKWFSDGCDFIFAKNSINTSSVIFDTPFEIACVDPCKKYKKYSREDIVTIVINLNGGYYSNSRTKTFKGFTGIPCYAGIVRTENTFQEEDENDFWKALADENLSDGQTTQNTTVTSYVRNFYNKMYDNLGLSKISDPFISAQILANSSVYNNINAAYEASNDIFKSNYTDDSKTSINDDLSGKIKNGDKYEYSKQLEKQIKYLYSMAFSPELREYLFNMVDECANTVNGKFCDKE